MMHNLNFVSLRKKRWWVLGFLSLLLFAHCEKDDICVDGDTPLLIIRFYDAENTTEFKEVTNLRVFGLGQDNTVSTFSDRTSIDSIGIPLRTNQTNTAFALIFDSADENEVETGNSDTLTFNYSTKEVFVSRACGFVANYEELSEDLTTDADNWIQSIEIVSSLIQTQDSAHVKIFH
ncbi:MAG: DUF6452 family protein [Flavobacteriaceae bacterium]